MLNQIKRRLEGRSAADIAEVSAKTISRALRSFSPAKRRAKILHRAFDDQWGTDTTSEIIMANLDFPTEMARNCGHYQASGAHALDEAMALVGFDPAQYAFIDVGSGKGRVVLCAAAVPFARAIGVEYSVKLDAIARDNAAIFAAKGGAKIAPEFWCGDAGSYSPPDGPLFVYLYNPFGAEIMANFIGQMEQAMDAEKRRIIVAYVNPQCAQEFDKRPRWSRGNTADDIIIFELDA